MPRDISRHEGILRFHPRDKYERLPDLVEAKSKTVHLGDSKQHMTHI